MDLAGLPVLIGADSAARADVVDRVLGSLPPSTHRAKLSITFSGEAPQPPGREPDEVRDGMSLWRRGETLVAIDPGGLVAVADADGARIAGESDQLGVSFRHLMQVVSTHVLAYHDRFVLHGAGIADQDGSYIVLGPSGAGKSSLTVAAVAAGWRVLGDDLTVLRVGPDGLELASIPRPWAVPTDLAAQAGLMTGPTVGGDSRDRRVVEGVALVAGWTPAIGTLIVGHGQLPTPVEIVPPREGVTMLVRAFFCAGDPTLLQRFFPVAAMMARLPTWSLRHPADPDLRLAAAVDNLLYLGEARVGRPRPDP